MEPQLLDLFDNQPLFSNFIELKNELVVHSLSNYSRQFTHLVGTNNSGKTHLLRSWVNLAQANHFSAIYINLQMENTRIAVNRLIQYSYIALDNIDNISSKHQEVVFNLFNKIKQESLSNFLLTSSNTSLDKLNLRSDLVTRLQSGLNLNLKMLNDDEILTALNQIISNEGIGIAEIELKFLISHYTRNIGQLVIAIRKIADRAVLEKRNITIPLIKKVLKINPN